MAKFNFDKLQKAFKQLNQQYTGTKQMFNIKELQDLLEKREDEFIGGRVNNSEVLKSIYGYAQSLKALSTKIVSLEADYTGDKGLTVEETRELRQCYMVAFECLILLASCHYWNAEDILQDLKDGNSAVQEW